MGTRRERWLWNETKRRPSDRGKRCIKLKPARRETPWRLQWISNTFVQFTTFLRILKMHMDLRNKIRYCEIHKGCIFDANILIQLVIEETALWCQQSQHWPASTCRPMSIPKFRQTWNLPNQSSKLRSLLSLTDSPALWRKKETKFYEFWRFFKLVKFLNFYVF